MLKFYLDIPDKYSEQLAQEGQFSVLTSLAIKGQQKVVEIKVSVLESKDFVHSAARLENVVNNIHEAKRRRFWFRRK
jgi:hypothetical protein